MYHHFSRPQISAIHFHTATKIYSLIFNMVIRFSVVRFKIVSEIFVDSFHIVS